MQLICPANDFKHNVYIWLPNPFVDFREVMWTSFKAMMSHVASYYFTSEPASLLHSPTIPDIQCRTNNDNVLHAAYLAFPMLKRKRCLVLEDSGATPSLSYSREIRNTDVRAHCPQFFHENQRSQMRYQENNMYASSFPRCIALLLRTDFIANSTISLGDQEGETINTVSLIPGAFMHNA